MGSEPDRFVIVRACGRADNTKDGSSYWTILSEIYREFQSAGGNWDRPVMLLRNGKVVVNSELSDLAWEYGETLRKAIDRAADETRKFHMPDWLAGQEKGSNHA